MPTISQLDLQAFNTRREFWRPLHVGVALLSVHQVAGEEFVHDHSIEKAEFHSIIEFVVLNLYFLPKTIFRVSGILISQALTTSNYFNYVGVIFNFEPINPLVMNCS